MGQLFLERSLAWNRGAPRPLTAIRWQIDLAAVRDLDYGPSTRSAVGRNRQPCARWTIGMNFLFPQGMIALPIAKECPQKDQ